MSDRTLTIVVVLTGLASLWFQWQALKLERAVAPVAPSGLPVIGSLPVPKGAGP
jgi:hypothetical protein